jgi:hypothetical protein
VLLREGDLQKRCAGKIGRDRLEPDALSLFAMAGLTLAQEGSIGYLQKGQ